MVIVQWLMMRTIAHATDHALGVSALGGRGMIKHLKPDAMGRVHFLPLAVLVEEGEVVSPAREMSCGALYDTTHFSPAAGVWTGLPCGIRIHTGHLAHLRNHRLDRRRHQNSPGCSNGLTSGAGSMATSGVQICSSSREAPSV